VPSQRLRHFGSNPYSFQARDEQVAIRVKFGVQAIAVFVLQEIGLPRLACPLQIALHHLVRFPFQSSRYLAGKRDEEPQGRETVHQFATGPRLGGPANRS
jgi:hypothetical protein